MRFLIAELVQSTTPDEDGVIRPVININVPKGAGWAANHGVPDSDVYLVAVTEGAGTASVIAEVADPTVTYKTAQGDVLLREHDGGAALREAFGGNFPAVG